MMMMMRRVMMMMMMTTIIMMMIRMMLMMTVMITIIVASSASPMLPNKRDDDDLDNNDDTDEDYDDNYHRSILCVADEVNSCVLRWSTGERSVGCISDPKISANAWMTSGLSYDLSFFNPSGSLIGYPDTGCAFLYSSMVGHSPRWWK